MPELPEVETYVRELEPVLYGRQVLDAQVYWSRIIAAPTAKQFCVKIKGERFAQFKRRGKYMLLGLASGRTLIIHLRMTGEIHVYSPEISRDKHTHVVLELDDGHHLHYRDMRKFGRIWLMDDPSPVLSSLGPEPLSEEFSAELLAAQLARRTASIKALLLNQSVVAGVGNIYADEALFRARIHPLRPGQSLQAEEVAELCGAIRAVLARGIEQKGSSLQNYVRLEGMRGSFQNEHQVFRKTGNPCPRCGHQIERIVVTQRSTHFCANCQL